MKNDYSYYTIAYSNLYQYLKKNNFTGYDNYDAANTKYFKNKSRNRWIGLAWRQFHLYSPINTRSLFNIEKTIDNQGSALIIKALLKSKIENSDTEIEKLLKYIFQKSLKYKYGKHCWNGHNYPIQGLSHFQPLDIPGVVGTEACASAFQEYHQTSGKFRDVIVDVKDFFLEKLLTKYNNNIIFLKYKPNTPSHMLVYNASAIGFSYLVKYNYFFENNSDKEITKLATKFFTFLVSHQKSDGSWYYSLNLNTNQERKQIDFHQGFILDSLYDYIKYTKPNNKIFKKSLEKGAEFYKKQQFYSDGRSKYRLPITWPVDIHNQAHGIITFAKLSEIKPEYLQFSKTIASWTIKNMQDKNLGYFYYQKWPFLTNKIPYIRWSQSWMMLSLSILLDTIKKGDTING